MTEWLDRLRDAHRRVGEIDRQGAPTVEFASVLRQLEYLIALEDGTEQDDSRLEEITLGVLAAHNLAGDLPTDLMEELCAISGTVRRDLRRQGRRMKHS